MSAREPAAPRGERLHITLFGLRNAGKSSLLNAMAGRSAVIVSDTPGTTTDPVALPMELGALGPVALCDTAGLDDEGELGALRVERSLERLSWTDLAILVTRADLGPAPAERDALRRLLDSGKPVLVAVTRADAAPDPGKEVWLASLGVEGGAPASVRVDARTLEAGAALRAVLIDLRDHAGRPIAGMAEAGPLEGLVKAGDLVMLVTPIDSAAPRGRLILPQAETLRDALDRGCVVMTARETEVAAAMASLSRPPRLVVTDSQAFDKVAAALPPDQALTSFSILFARKKGELSRFAPGLARVDELAASRPGTGDLAPLRLLALEACSHNRTHEDIATVKIPAILSQKTGKPVELTVARQLSDAAVDSGYDLAVVCGGCMATRGRMLAQLDALAAAGVPALNFGLFLAWAHGVFPRAVECLD